MNRPKVSVFLGISLDGYIAGKGGDLSWLSMVETDPPEDTGFHALMNDIDVMVLGRNTYDTALSFAGWPYSGKRVVILTHRSFRSRHGEEQFSGDPVSLLQSLKQDGSKHVYLDGGAVTRTALAAGIVDELTLSWVPIILGDGIALFEAGLPRSGWRLTQSRAFPSGLVQSRYVPGASSPLG